MAGALYSTDKKIPKEYGESSKKANKILISTLQSHLGIFGFIQFLTSLTKNIYQSKKIDIFNDFNTKFNFNQSRMMIDDTDY